jgi:hypothetical protein
MITLRDASKVFIVVLALLGAVVLWWRWPEDTVTGAWSGITDGETIELAFLQEATGALHGHGVIVADSTGVAAAAGKVEGTRAGDRLAINLAADRQQIFTLLVQLGPRGQLLGQYFRPGIRAMPITLIRK